MKKILASFALAMLVGCVAPPPPAPKHEVKDATVLVALVGVGTCSGTIVGPHAILSATHCFEGNPAVSIRGSVVHVRKRIDDAWDHTILIVDQTYTYWAARGASPQQGQYIHIWGNPDDKLDWFRVGYVVGNDKDESGKPLLVYDINGFFGDSGSGVFNDQGQLVAVTSICVFDSAQGVPFKMMGSYELHFTAQDWAQVQS